MVLDLGRDLQERHHLSRSVSDCLMLHYTMPKLSGM
jgi:hypothetical protein